jgi:hypothetical protein
LRNGQILSTTLKEQRKRYKEIITKQEGPTFCKPSKSFKPDNTLDLSPGMKEYHNSRNFSPLLESNKFWNLEQFFMVSFI